MSANVTKLQRASMLHEYTDAEMRCEGVRRDLVDIWTEVLCRDFHRAVTVYPVGDRHWTHCYVDWRIAGSELLPLTKAENKAFNKAAKQAFPDATFSVHNTIVNGRANGLTVDNCLEFGDWLATRLHPVSEKMLAILQNPDVNDRLLELRLKSKRTGGAK